jgi:hypothetical protein
MAFLKENLSNQHYTWSEGNQKPVFTGSPSRRLFDRFNGEQVLFMINLYGSVENEFSTEEGQRIEAMILNELPMEAKSEMSVFNWLKEISSQPS